MMAAGNPNWWSINTTTMQQSHESSPPPPPHASHEYFYGSNSSTADHHHHHSNNQDFPRSWSQLLLGGGGLEGSELLERFVSSSPFQYKKLEEEGEKWEDQILNPSSSSSVVVDLIKQESVAPTTTNYDDQFHGSNYTNTHSWSPLIMPPPPLSSSSSSSVVTSLSTSLLNFSGTATQSARRNNNNSYHHPPPDQNSSECNSSSSGGVLKKPKIQHSSSTQPILKVRKEKLGDRITALHQLVSPFGKTDTASVLSEAIGYIRFLQAQIEALSSPYMGNVSAAGSMGHQHQSEESLQDLPNDLRTRGLCLVPVSCTQQIGSETGADYWAPALGGGF